MRSVPLIQFVLFFGTPMHSAAVDFRFRRLAGFTVLLAFLFALSRLGETQNTAHPNVREVVLVKPPRDMLDPLIASTVRAR